MIIQQPDGRMEVCALPPLLVHWARTFWRGVQRRWLVVRCDRASTCCCGGAA